MAHELPDLNAMNPDALFDALNPRSELLALFRRVRTEDLADVGDVTSMLVCEPGQAARASIVSRESGRIAGLRALPALLDAFVGKVELELLVRDGDAVGAGGIIGIISGHLHDVLAVERALLNLVGRLSGIATLTARYVARVASTGAQIYDTRKTTPGLRGLEKYAVRCGGGWCHRTGLHDAVLIKDNHLTGVDETSLTGWLTSHLAQSRAQFALRFVEVEVDSLSQLDAVLACPAGLIDYVLLDNFSLEDAREAVQRRDRVKSACALEASGGVTLETVRAIAETGVERISVGALTHSAMSLDIGLDLQ